MPGTKRYSATFDRTYEEDDAPSRPPTATRTRSQSLCNGPPNIPSHGRSASIDRMESSSLEQASGAESEKIPTRGTAKITARPAHNPMQFVKIGSSALYKKAEDQLKKVKQAEVIKEDEEEWLSNLDNWKSRRRKLSESAFKRQEEMKQLEQDEQVKVTNQKKTKTFSEMMEERAHRGRAASLCLYMNQPDPDVWKLLTDGKKEDDITVNPTDSNPSPFTINLDKNENFEKKLDDKVCNNSSPVPDVPSSIPSSNGIQKTRKIGRSAQQNLTSLHNGTPTDVKNDNHATLPQDTEDKSSESVNGISTDSGLDSLSSSHRTGDAADSSLDFSQGSSSSTEVEMPDLIGMVTTGTQLLEEFSCCENCNFNKCLHKKLNGMELSLKIPVKLEHGQNCGFTLKSDSGQNQILVNTVSSGSFCDNSGLKEGDCILAVNGKEVRGMTEFDVETAIRNSSSDVIELSILRSSGSCCKKCRDTNCNHLSVKQGKSAEVSHKNNSVVKMTVLPYKNVCLTKTSENFKNVLIKNDKENEKTSVKPPSVLPKPKLQTKVSKQTKQELDGVKDKSFSSDSKFCQSSKGIKKGNGNFINNCEMPSSFSDENSKRHDSAKIDELHNEGKNKYGVLKSSELPKGKQKKALVQSPTSPSEDNSESQSYFNSWNSSLNAVNTTEKLIITYESSDSDSHHLSHNKQVSTGPASVVNDTCDFSSKEVTDSVTECINSVHQGEKIKDCVSEGHLTSVEKVTEEMERLILEQLEKEEQARENAPKSVTELPPCSISSDLSLNEEIILRDSSSLNLEPPKEKPPPPPVDSESPNAAMKSLVRVNSTKRIKKELWKRRSDFLGIESSREVEVYLEKQDSLPSFTHDAVFKMGNKSNKENIHWFKQNFISEEEQLAQKEREIIEDLEWEEKKRKKQENNKDIPDEVILMDSAEEKERIFRLQVERRRMGEERLQREEQRIRMEEERQLRDREESIRKQEETLKMEREKLRFEQEALQREREKHWLTIKNQQGYATETENLPKVNNDKPYTSVVTTSMSLSPEEEENVLHTSHSSQSTSDVSFNGMQMGKDDADQSASWSQVQDNVKETCIPPSVMKNSMSVSSKSKIGHNNLCAKHDKIPSQKRQPDLYSESRYNQNHWLIQEAEIRRIVEQKERQRMMPSIHTQFPVSHNAVQRPCGPPPPPPPRKSLSYTSLSYGCSPDHQWSYNYRIGLGRKHAVPTIVPSVGVNHHLTNYSDFRHDNLSSPSVEPSRIVPIENQEQMLSVSGRKRCSHCGEELGRGAAMIIESLQLVYHIQCFRCCVCQAQLGNGSCGTDVRVRNNKLHCQNCYSNDEAGLKFSQV